MFQRGDFDAGRDGLQREVDVHVLVVDAGQDVAGEGGGRDAADHEAVVVGREAG